MRNKYELLEITRNLVKPPEIPSRKQKSLDELLNNSPTNGKRCSTAAAGCYYIMTSQYSLTIMTLAGLSFTQHDVKVCTSAWPILGAETILIPKHRDLILSILETRYHGASIPATSIRYYQFLLACRAISSRWEYLRSASIGYIAQLASKPKRSKAQVSNIENS